MLKIFKKEKDLKDMRSLLEIPSKDLYFLRELQDRELHYLGKNEDPKVTEKEVQEILDISSRNDFLFYPGQMGQFNLGYKVLTQLRMPKKNEDAILNEIKDNTPPAINLAAFSRHLNWEVCLFECVERALPRSYQGEKGFLRLSEFFNGDSNLILANNLGKEWINKYSRYSR